MSRWDSLRASPDYAALMDLSERLGRDPLQVQAAGGNTSIKAGGAMWVKASGTWLAEARERDIMVPVDAARLCEGIGGDAEDRAFVPEGQNASGLRPSIETSFHAALDWPVVVHTHCVATIATAVRRDAATVVADRLSGLGAAFVPYCKPGRELTRAIIAAVTPETRVIVLGNHGLIACGATPAEAESLLREVSRRLDRPALPPLDPNPAFAEALSGTGWTLAPPEAQALAMDPARLAVAAGATLYPDHLIFLGPGVAVAPEDIPPAVALARIEALDPPRKLALFPGLGAAVPAAATPAILALARALGDVAARIDPDADLTRLTPAQEAELLDWDAEKYRQSLGAAR